MWPCLGGSAIYQKEEAVKRRDGLSACFPRKRRLLARLSQVVADAPARVHHIGAGIAGNDVGV
jgi:hypothetical protein